MAIVDEYGFPAMMPRLLDAADRYSRERPSWPVLNESIQKAVDVYDWQTVVSASNRLYANMGIARGAIDMKAMSAVGRAWTAQFEGGDGSKQAKEWGEAATKWLNDEWYGVCDVRGSAFDFKTQRFLDSINVDRGGDFGVMLSETEDGYPQTQRVPSYAIGCRNGYEKVVKSGPYTGLRINNGIIFNRIGRPVAYRVLGEVEAEDKDVSARDMRHVFEPQYYDQGRGFPVLTHAINDLRDMLQSQKWEQHAQLIASSIGLIEYNETGAGDPSDPGTLMGTTSGDDASLTTQRLEGGMIRYFKAGSGSKLESFRSERPGEVWESFWDRLTRSTLIGMNWPPSLLWKPEGSGTFDRIALAQAQASVEDRQDLLRPVATWECGYAVSKAIKLGILKKYPGKDKGGMLKWGFAMPRKMTIDKGRDGKTWENMYKLGAENLGPWLAANNEGTAEEHYRERAYEIAVRKRVAAEVSAETGQTIEDREMCMLTPNDMSVEQASVDTSKEA